MKESLYHPKMVSNRLCALSLHVLPKTEEAESGPLLSGYLYVYIYICIYMCVIICIYVYIYTVYRFSSLIKLPSL